MEKIKKSESVFVFLREAEEKGLIGTHSEELRQRLKTLLEKLINDARKENNTNVGFALLNLQDLINQLQNYTKEEYFNFGVLQGQLLEDYSE